MQILTDWLNLNPIRFMASIVFALLVVSSSIVFILAKLKPSQNFKELSDRINSWWIMAFLFFSSVLIDSRAAIVLFAFISFLGIKEYFTLIHTRLEDHRILFWSYLAIPVQYWWIYSGWKAMFLIFIPVYVFLFNPIRRLFTGQTQGMVESMSKIHWGLMAFVFCISHVAGLLTLKPNAVLPSGGAALLIYLVFMTQINDVSQYIWGKLFGKHPIAPKVSPKKTWEGFLGGLCTTILLSLALRFLSGLPVVYALASGLLIGVFGFFGDLVMSAVKRDVGVKDASSLIPGHGGIIDRMDSLVYTAPIFFHFVSYFFYPAGAECALR